MAFCSPAWFELQPAYDDPVAAYLLCRCAVDALQQAAPHVRIVIYVREGVTAAQLVQEASSRFNVKLRRSIEVSCQSHH
jgi:hypothetical protein